MAARSLVALRLTLRRRATGWTLRRRVGLFFVFAGGVLAILVAATTISLAHFAHDGNQAVYRWGPATVAGHELFADLVNQETGVRGFALTTDSQFLQPFDQYSSAQREDRRRLAGLVSGDALLERDLARFDNAAAAWRRQVAIPLISLVNGHDPSAASVAESTASKGRFDHVRTTAARLIRDVGGRNDAAIASRHTALIALWISLGVSLALLFASGLAGWRGLHRWILGPVDRLSAQTRQVARGDSRKAIRPVGPPELRALAKDVERMRRRIGEELDRLARAGDELTRSNADLEQFAYVASHDLSEPLRKVANFCQLLERQYGDQLDDRAREYIGYAVDGAKRMQALIADLLVLSRVGRTSASFVPVDTGAALATALRQLEDEVVASGGGVGHSELPVVLGDPTLLASLFENLIGNAIKYRSDAPPLVVVTAVADPDEGMWAFAVADNGIGIDPQYAERIFAIFQRLHVRDAYPGTGIGLTLCRKIVEFHGGRIWLDTSVSSGATLRFTLPKEAVE